MKIMNLQFPAVENDSQRVVLLDNLFNSLETEAWLAYRPCLLQAFKMPTTRLHSKSQMEMYF